MRVDPKASVDPTNSDALEVAGVNNRYNTITVDGVRQSDDFGLNNNGYPTPAQPTLGGRHRGRFRAVGAVFRRVLVLPRLDHQHGHQVRHERVRGSAYYYRGDDGLLGDQTATRTSTSFRRGHLRRHLGGPIIKDKLFFFLAYEKLDRKAPQDIGAAGSGFPVEVPGVSQADYDRIRQIGLDVYGYDVGETLASAPEEDEKILAKVDWNINDAHRATLSSSTRRATSSSSTRPTTTPRPTGSARRRTGTTARS